MGRNIFSIIDGVCSNPALRLLEPVTASISDDEHIAVFGSNGSGKSLFVDMLLGKYYLRNSEVKYDFYPSLSSSVHDNVRYVAFCDTYGTSHGAYYQQRWNMHDQDEIPSVGEVLGPIGLSADKDLFNLFGIGSMLEKKIIMLSSGETRKLQLFRALEKLPRVLVIDNPYIGLDAGARVLLTDLLRQLVRGFDMRIVVVVSRVGDIPDFITHVIEVRNHKVMPKTDRVMFTQEFPKREKGYSVGSNEEITTLLSQCKAYSDSVVRPLSAYSGKGQDTQELVSLRNVSLRYGGHVIFSHLNWTIKKGERWALVGDNGSGKSALLSLICADNPQAYACDINLFGRKRGSGESIWDIKRNIGYVSPEMHRAYRKNVPVTDVVASGLYDSVGLYLHPKPNELEVCNQWLGLFGIAHLARRSFLTLSSGEQRLVLLVRAFVKNPCLLILDEPFHGLDDAYSERVLKIISAFCADEHKTLIMVTHYRHELPGLVNLTYCLRKTTGDGSIGMRID